jgi:hypothetical protein
VWSPRLPKSCFYSYYSTYLCCKSGNSKVATGHRRVVRRVRRLQFEKAGGSRSALLRVGPYYVYSIQCAPLLQYNRMPHLSKAQDQRPRGGRYLSKLARSLAHVRTPPPLFLWLPLTNIASSSDCDCGYSNPAQPPPSSFFLSTPRSIVKVMRSLGTR